VIFTYHVSNGRWVWPLLFSLAQYALNDRYKDAYVHQHGHEHEHKHEQERA